MAHRNDLADFPLPLELFQDFQNSEEIIALDILELCDDIVVGDTINATCNDVEGVLKVVSREGQRLVLKRVS